MDQYVNIKYYFYCRHLLGIKSTQIGIEINDLFRVKIPVREGLAHWADCINTNSNSSDLFKFDPAHKKCFKHLTFELKSTESTDTQEIQFYALCRFQLNVRAAQVSDELKILYADRAPSLLCLHTWLISCLKKETNSNEPDYEEIDLTSDDVTMNESPDEHIDDSLASANTHKNKNETTIKYYFYCRNKFNLRIPDIYKEMKTLFDDELLPKSIGSLYNWQKGITNGLDLFKYDASNRLLYSNLKFELDINEENSVKRIQFYALCRYQLGEDVVNILDELKKLFGARSPSLNLLENWISNLSKKQKSTIVDNNDIIEIDDDDDSSDLPVENEIEIISNKDAFIEQLKHELNLKTKTYEQNLFSKQLEIREKDALIEQLREELNEKQKQSEDKKFLKLDGGLYEKNVANLKKIVIEMLNQSGDCARACQLKTECESQMRSLDEAVKGLIQMYQLESNESKLRNYQMYQAKSKNVRLFYLNEIRKLQKKNFKLNARLKCEFKLNKSMLSESEHLKAKLNEYNKTKARQTELSSYQSRINLLEQNLAKMSKKLDESYEFLIEKETNSNKMNQDIDVFKHKLSVLLRSSVENLGAFDLSSDNAQLYDCLLDVRSHLESRYVKKFENNQCKIVHRVLDVSQLKQLDYLQQIKLLKTTKPPFNN